MYRIDFCILKIFNFLKITKEEKEKIIGKEYFSTAKDEKKLVYLLAFYPNTIYKKLRHYLCKTT